MFGLEFGWVLAFFTMLMHIAAQFMAKHKFQSESSQAERALRRNDTATAAKCLHSRLSCPQDVPVITDPRVPGNTSYSQITTGGELPLG